MAMHYISARYKSPVIPLRAKFWLYFCAVCFAAVQADSDCSLYDPNVSEKRSLLVRLHQGLPLKKYAVYFSDPK